MPRITSNTTTTTTKGAFIPNPQPPTTSTNTTLTVTTVVAAAAKNTIIPNAVTPVRMEWCCCWTTTSAIPSRSTRVNHSNQQRLPILVTNTKPSVSKTHNTTMYGRNNTSQPTTTSTNTSTNHTLSRKNCPGRSCCCVLIHQSNQEETWPGGAIWDISWCMTQLIIGILYLGHTTSSITPTGSVGVSSSSSSSSSSSTRASGTDRIAITTTTTFYHDSSTTTTNSLFVLKGQNQPMEEHCVSNTISSIPPRLLEWIHPSHPQPRQSSAESLAALMLLLSTTIPSATSIVRNNTRTRGHNQRSSRYTNPSRTKHPNQNKSVLILELGCGTGWTGIVIAAAIASATTTTTTTTQCTVILTDLEVVIQKVTLPNVQRNIPNIKQNVMKTTFPLYEYVPTSDDNTNTVMEDTNIVDGSTTPSHPPSYVPLQIYTIHPKTNHGRLIAAPLCWGNRTDMNTIQSMIRYLQSQSTVTTGSSTVDSTTTTTPDDISDGCHRTNVGNEVLDGIPDILIVGDVAYQHKPGAASHFDILLETILRFTKTDRTLLIFGLRIRMNASMDLYDMLLQHFVDIVEPILPHEIDPIRFPYPTKTSSKSIHTMTIHFMKRK